MYVRVWVEDAPLLVGESDLVYILMWVGESELVCTPVWVSESGEDLSVDAGVLVSVCTCVGRGISVSVCTCVGRGNLS